ncbi:iron-sulfur protein NUBPL isoform X1 [Diorhabda carinulata]|uniref:iron-sulfur protein NUBPL isoform X1 n=2 Tax=Diorhabda carinulata TaxID=1163345 RepID=UPI0025A13C19|nr:iron-sulfur protein NUBPL isoform X1 [Diorhabda carinulata]
MLFFIKRKNFFIHFKKKLLLQNLVHLSTDNVDINEKRQQLMSRGLPKQKPITGVKNIILVSSGKGGVGKSTTSVNIATVLKHINPNKGIGLLDTDVFGPSIPLMMNLNDQPFINKENLMEPLVNYGVKCMSMGFLVGKEAPVIWRGLMVMQALEKLIRQVHWGTLEYLIVDTPPGTGDTLLSLVQNLPITGVVLVTTPQTAALEVTKRGAGLFKKLNVPIIGLVENMNYIKCTACFKNIDLFGKGTTKLAHELSCSILASLPLDPGISSSTNEGIPIVASDKESDVSKLYEIIARCIIKFVENK